MILARLALLLAALLPLAAGAASHRWSSLGEGGGSTGSLDAGKLQVGVVRPAPKDLPALAWESAGDAWVSRFDAVSEGALGLRSRLVLEGTGALELRVSGDDGRVETMAIPAGATEAWGPWTPGDTQAIEVWSEGRPKGSVRLAGVAHFDRPLSAKAAGACTIDIACTTGNPALDAAIAERKRSMARITFVEGTGAFVCTGTLVESAREGESFFLTANHCIGTQALASSITSRWFYENSACGAGPVNPANVQVAGGMDVVFADPNTDMTLLRMRAPPPAGVTYAKLDARKLTNGESVTSLSHPDGDVAKWALASVAGEARFVNDWPQAAWLTTFTRGIVQGGSSGSGLYTLAPDGTLALRSILSATTLTNGNGLSCSNTGEYAIYNRLDVFLPEASQYLSAAGPRTDDHGNRPSEATFVALGASPVTVAGRIDYLGDVDVFRVIVPQKGVLIVRASGGIDTVGLLLNRDGAGIEHNDDAQTSALDFGLTSSVTAGTYYLSVSHWESAGTGPYQLQFEFQPIGDNYTDLWWNPAESGWGMNVNHQSDIVFTTLFTYAADGSPLWLVMTEGRQQADGSFSGALYRAAGPAFGASPWNPAGVKLTPVGTMRIAFTGTNAATLDYTVDGVPVRKSIERQLFSSPTSCKWSVFDRSFTFNYQDLWWKPTEAGWGINFTQQGGVLFATLFIYDEQGRNAWYAMTNGRRVSGSTDADTWSGAFYRMTGPRFDTQPWTPVTPREVGTLTVEFTAGNAANLTYTINGITVTKVIEREAFAPLRPECKAASNE